MGDPLSQETLDVFFEEVERLEKEAQLSRFLPSFLRGARGAAKVTAPVGKEGWRELGSRLRHPIEGLKKGWGALSPMAGTTRAERIKRISESGMKIPFTKSRIFRQGEHLRRLPMGFREAWGKGGVKGLAEEASRTGWTGGGRATKYLPGHKSMIAGFGGLGAYETATAPEGKRLSTALGELGSTAGWVASGGLSTLPSLAAWLAPGIAGSVAGGKLDKMIASKKIEELGLTSEQVGNLSSEQVVQLLNLHRQYMKDG